MAAVRVTAELAFAPVRVTVTAGQPVTFSVDPDVMKCLEQCVVVSRSVPLHVACRCCFSGAVCMCLVYREIDGVCVCVFVICVCVCLCHTHTHTLS